MKVNVKLETGAATVSALMYAFPKRGNAPEGYSLTVGGEKAEVAMTGGGKYPRYVYVKIGGVSHYLPKNVVPVAGSDVEVVAAEAEKKKKADDGEPADPKPVPPAEVERMKAPITPTKAPRAPRAPRAPK